MQSLSSHSLNLSDLLNLEFHPAFLQGAYYFTNTNKSVEGRHTQTQEDPQLNVCSPQDFARNRERLQVYRK